MKPDISPQRELYPSPVGTQSADRSFDTAPANPGPESSLPPLRRDLFAAAIPRSILEHRGALKLNSRDIEVLALLLAHRVKGLRTVRPSQVRLATLACCDTETIRRSIRRLRAARLDGRPLITATFGMVAGSRYRRWTYDLSTVYGLLPSKLSDEWEDSRPRRRAQSRSNHASNSPQNCRDVATVGCLVEQQGEVRSDALVEPHGHGDGDQGGESALGGIAFGDDEEGQRKHRAADALHQAGVIPRMSADLLVEKHSAERVEYLLRQAKLQKSKVGGGWFQAALAGRFWPAERKQPRAATSSAPSRGPRAEAAAAPTPAAPPPLPKHDPAADAARDAARADLTRLKKRPDPPKPPRQKPVPGRPAVALDVPPPANDAEAAERWNALQARAAIIAEVEAQQRGQTDQADMRENTAQERDGRPRRKQRGRRQ